MPGIVIALAVAMSLQLHNTHFLFDLLLHILERHQRESGSDSEQPETAGYARHFNALQSSAIRSSAIVIVWQP